MDSNIGRKENKDKRTMSSTIIRPMLVPEHVKRSACDLAHARGRME